MNRTDLNEKLTNRLLKKTFIQTHINTQTQKRKAEKDRKQANKPKSETWGVERRKM